MKNNKKKHRTRADKSKECFSTESADTRFVCLENVYACVYGSARALLIGFSNKGNALPYAVVYVKNNDFAVFGCLLVNN